ncbi:MAG: DUF2950 domain-containing protein [Hyphomicrobium sp.]
MRTLKALPISKMFVSLALAMTALMAAPAGSYAASSQEVFKSPDEAVDALVSAVKSDDKEALIKVLGPDASDVIDSGDDVYDATLREKFVSAYDKAHHIEAEGDAKSILVIGDDDYPFPIPLVASNGSWQFDTPAGAEEILSRRIGENELNTIEVMRAYVDAQDDYAAVDRDGKGPQYARRLMSSAGKHDGLYWQTNEGEPESPIGALVAKASAQGYKPGNAHGETSNPYHGYVFKMLNAQGPLAQGGAREFVLNGRMIGGFGLVATPADYGNSGVMTFIVNQDGKVYQRDLGPDSSAFVSKMTVFNPGKDWHEVDSE